MHEAGDLVAQRPANRFAACYRPRGLWRVAECGPGPLKRFPRFFIAFLPFRSLSGAKMSRAQEPARISFEKRASSGVAYGQVSVRVTASERSPVAVKIRLCERRFPVKVVVQPPPKAFFAATISSADM
jgi:hypothetical protein